MSKPLWVLDTNVVLDLLHFDDPASRPLLQRLEAGQAACAVNAATFDEWQRVLAYPEFSLDATGQAALVARYHALSCRVPPKQAIAGLPQCSDPDDQMFIELAAACGAQALVSKDRALLKLRRRCAPLFRLMTPAEAASWLTTEI